MKILRHEKRSADDLEQKFKFVMDKIVSLRHDGFVTNKDFDDACRAMYGTSIRSTLQKRFASQGSRENGLRKLREKFGYRFRIAKRTREEIIAIYISVFYEKGKQPTESDMQAKGISMNSVYRIFSSHIDAVTAMYKELKIDKLGERPINVKINPQKKKGNPLDKKFNLGLIEEPVNEQGVVFLFSKLHEKLGFPEIIRVQQEFPDCVAACNRYKRGELTEASIEFKYLCSTAFKKNRPANVYQDRKTHYLICWVNDSAKNTEALARAGVEVISIKDELPRL